MATITDQQMLDALRTAYLNLLTSGNKSYTYNGRTFERQEMGQMQQAIIWLEGRIDAASQPGAGTILTKQGEAL